MQGQMIDLRDSYKTIRAYLYLGTSGSHYREWAKTEGLKHLHEIQRILRYLEN